MRGERSRERQGETACLMVEMHLLITVYLECIHDGIMARVQCGRGECPPLPPRARLARGGVGAFPRRQSIPAARMPPPPSPCLQTSRSNPTQNKKERATERKSSRHSHARRNAHTKDACSRQCAQEMHAPGFIRTREIPTPAPMQKRHPTHAKDQAPAGCLPNPSSSHTHTCYWQPILLPLTRATGSQSLFLSQFSLLSHELPISYSRG